MIGAGFLSLQSLLLNAVGIFATAYIIRRLGAFRYGEWAVASSLAAAHLIVTNPGLRTLFVRDISRRPECAEDLLAEQLGLRIALSGLAAVSAMSICLLLQYSPTILACMAVGCVWILLSAVWSTLGDFLQSLERFGTYSGVALLSGLVVTASTILIVYLGYGPLALTGAYLTAPALNVALYWNAARKHVPVRVSWNRPRAAVLLRESRLIGLNAFASAVRERAEQLLVPKMVGIEAFGIFTSGTLVPDRLRNIPDSICTAFYPRVSLAMGRNSASAPNEAVVDMLTFGLAASVPLAIVGTSLAPSIAEILLPGASDVVRITMQITAWSVPAVATSLAMGYALQASGHQDLGARAGLWATAVSAALSVSLITVLGMVGAAWSFLARPVILTLMLVPPFSRVFPAVIPKLPIGRILLAASLPAAICLLPSQRQFVLALGLAGLGCGAYCLALLVTRVLPPSEVRRHLASSVGLGR